MTSVVNLRVEIEYTNHRGERGRRVIVPKSIFFGTTAWHPEPQWLLEAWDETKVNWRNFAMKDIHDWDPIK